ncbi:hypothetical protein [Papillibacter cinnamivorans]|nr:hypothetical protein [Papillibacter cinnamivorans]
MAVTEMFRYAEILLPEGGGEKKDLTKKLCGFIIKQNKNFV